MPGKPRGTLIMIGGHEDKEGDCVILREVVARANRGQGRLVLATVASQVPDELAALYVPLFTRLGAHHIDVLQIHDRADANDPATVARIEGASLVFFAGGDQLRITSRLGGTLAFHAIAALYHAGGTIAGTSAGGAAMSETMVVAGLHDEVHDVTLLGMAPGLGLAQGLIVDTHFATRTRFGRLVGAVAENPENVGLGIDEDTAIILRANTTFRVIGSGTVYVFDGGTISYSALSDAYVEGVRTIWDLRLHILSAGGRYSLTTRRPVGPPVDTTGARQ